MGDGFYRSKDPTNSMKVLKEEAVKEKPKEQRKHKLHTPEYLVRLYIGN